MSTAIRYRREVNDIPLLKTKQSEPETAEQLAAEHARAEQEYETRRLSVLDRATTRRKELLDLAREAQQEAAKHDALAASIS